MSTPLCQYDYFCPVNSLDLDLLKAAVFDKIETTAVKNGRLDVIFSPR